jgi:hypothetical protein
MQPAEDTGVSALWILANISYAGMKAQGHPSFGWRCVAFIFGFPGTLISLFVVRENGGRAYGIELLRSRPQSPPTEVIVEHPSVPSAEI